MPDVPLSRRARRDMEALAAERAAAQAEAARSPAPGVSSGDAPSVDTGGLTFSRRDRRRVERLARPMESWTAEEEMIATGHIPAMTPERIAEQEKLAREAAERAAADAQTASAELRILAQRDLGLQRPIEDSTPPVRVPSADIPLVQPAPRADSDAPLEERAIVEPYSPRFEIDEREMKSARDDSQPVEIPTGFDPEAKIERTPAPTGEPDHDNAGGQPIAWPESFDSILAPSSEETRPTFAGPPASEAPGDELPVAAETPEAAQAVADMREAEAAAARAKVFEELFPPGSSQAALLEHDRLARESATAQPEQDDDEEAERKRGIEEIRRLTEAAISSIEKNARPESAPSESQDRYAMPAETEEGQGFQGFGAAASPPEWQQPESSPMRSPGALAPPSGEFPTAPAPHQATFDATVRTAPTEIPIRHMDQPQPSQESMPSPWGSHPIESGQASGSRDVSSFQPVSDVPRPDFSQLNNRRSTGQLPSTSDQFPTTGGQLPTTGALFNVDPSATGQIAPLRRTPDLPPVGGASHFKWLHLAVIGALVFVLGVVIYNVWLGQ